jgi:hypothetical protein
LPQIGDQIVELLIMHHGWPWPPVRCPGRGLTMFAFGFPVKQARFEMC